MLRRNGLTNNYDTERYNILLQIRTIFRHIINIKFTTLFMNFVLFVNCNIIATHTHDGHSGFMVSH